MTMHVRPLVCTSSEIVGRTIICEACDRVAPASFTAEPDGRKESYCDSWICCSYACALQAAIRASCGEPAPDLHPEDRYRAWCRAQDVLPDWTWSD